MIKTFIIYFAGVLSFFVCLSKPLAAQAPIALEEENVLIHCDRNFYLSGETMWFKIYVTAQHSYQLQSLSKTAYVELTGPAGRSLLQAKIEVQNGLGSGSFLLPEEAASGNYELTAYTNRMKNLPSAVFKKSITLVNTFQTFDTTAFVFAEKDGVRDLQPRKTPDSSFHPGQTEARPYVPFPIKINPDQQSYGTRSMVKLEVLPVNKEEAFSANFSVAVYKENALNAPGGVLNKARNGTSYNQPLLQEEQVFLPELNGFVMVVSVRNLAGKPVSGVPVTLALSGKLALVRWGESDEKGFVYFNFKNVYGPQQILLRTSPQYAGKVQMEILKSFSRPQKTNPLPRATFKESYLAIVEEMHNHLQVSKAFYPADPEPYLPRNRDSISFYGRAYRTYLLDDYKRFVTMEEVLREYVQEVSVRLRNGKYSVMVLNKQLVDLSRYLSVDKMMDYFDPLILIDGLPVSPNTLMKYDPLKVRKLEVLGEKYNLGRNVYDGILSFTTYSGNFEDLSLEREDLLSEEQGWQYTRKFFMPDYNKTMVKNNRLPDFRELLYWEPQIKVAPEIPAKISFFTGDLTGKFLVEIQGLTTDGKIIHETIPIEVKETKSR